MAKWFESYYRVIRYILHGEMHQIVRPFASNDFIMNYRWMNNKNHLELSCNKNFMPMNIVTARNATGAMPILQWMYLPPWILSPRNSVRVVLLIARGWRGTSLPRVNVRKEIQRCKCWAFSLKARLQRNLSWRINQKKRNIYGVVPHTTYANPG